MSGEGEVAGVIRVRGGATLEEIAALAAVLSAVSGAGGPDDGSLATAGRRGAPGWASPVPALRHPLLHGPGAWQRTYRT
ncbi:MAG: acyl-CoA carboxylase epsilon subunit [Dermatophilaceae bacterium]